MTQWGKAGQVGQVQLSILNIYFLLHQLILQEVNPWHIPDWQLTSAVRGWASGQCCHVISSHSHSLTLGFCKHSTVGHHRIKNRLDQLAPFQAAIILHLLTAKVNDGRMSWKDPASYRKDIYWGQEETRMWTIIFDSFKLEVEPDCAFVAGKRLVVEVRSLGILKQRQVNNLTGESINCKYQKPIWPIYISSRLCYNIKLDIINLNI